MDDLKNKTVLVTGGTGFIGKPLCTQLVARGAHVFVLTRRKIRSGSNITYINTLADMPVSGVDIIINLAGEPISQRWTPATKRKIEDSRIATTHALIDYIKGAQHKPQLLISGSAIGYYGTSETQTFNENSDPQPANLFSSNLCIKWENTALSAAHHSVRTVLLRLGVVLEKDGGVLKKLLLPFQCGLGGKIGSGQQWFSWIDRDDLIKLIFFIIDHADIHGPVNATAPYPVTNKEFTACLARAVQRPALLPAPAQVLKLAFGQMADEIMLQGQKVLPSKAVEHGFVYDYPRLEQSLQKILK